MLVSAFLNSPHLPAQRTFLAITTLVAACCTLLTVPPLPEPSSRRTIRSSAFKSSWNSTPISSVSCLSSLARLPGTWASPAEGAGFGGGALRASPLRFFLFIVLGLNGSAILLVGCAGRCQTSGIVSKRECHKLYSSEASCPAVCEGKSARQRCQLFRVCRPNMGRRWLANHGDGPDRGQRLLDCPIRVSSWAVRTVSETQGLIGKHEM